MSRETIQRYLIILAIALVGGFIGSYLYLAYGQRLLPLVTNGGKDNLMTVIQDDNNKVIRLSEDSATIDIVQQVSPSVVSVVIKKDVNSQQQIDPFFQFSPFDQFFGTPQITPTPKQQTEPDYQKVGGGSGFIISSDGYIATNRHVISDEQAQYSVVLNDGKEYPAKVVGTDLFLDIGVLKIEATNLPVVKFGNSDDLAIGQTVIAIGNALAEFSNTVTKGVISGIGRSVIAGGGGTSEKLEDVIQTDAAINPGNSGGPLLNLAGEVVGINTAVSSQGQLIGFAIPINSIRKVLDGVKQTGEITRPYLGVRYIILNDTIIQENKLKVDHGALIIRGDRTTDLAIVPGSPADKAGLRENDVLLSLNGKPINQDNSLSQMIAGFNPGDKIELEIYSQGQSKKVIVTLEKYQSE